ncbi:hypothetical protein TBR22_A42760 [Luteitalea sp. TBR-22]|uniref:general stress protein n=1 Tax=Luteitalea sp. TBR-22 TaxID=2802971 RepID=UPI001AF6907E|nr:general stress protein [Luteitalea sp. TBR-22]BCS35050.1 hypothetical protein TBR22_A42760 [Luteitalea sp. TBR-22]
MNPSTTTATVAAGTAPPDRMIGDITVSMFQSQADAEAAVRSLQAAGFDMTKLSIVGTDYRTDSHVVGFYSTGDRVRTWGGVGAFWGSVWGMLFGAAFFVIPGIGPVLVAGPLVAAIVGAIEGAVVVGGLSAVSAALISLGVPRNSVLDLETAIKAGKYLLVAHGTPGEVERARQLLGSPA